MLARAKKMVNRGFHARIDMRPVTLFSHNRFGSILAIIPASCVLYNKCSQLSCQQLVPPLAQGSKPLHVSFGLQKDCILTSVYNSLFSTVCDKRRLQTCRLADSKVCRPTFFVTGLWANFIRPLFTVGELQSMSGANNSANGLQTQQCPIRQVTGNPCRGRLNIGRTVT